jgi:hypothetical protein
MRMQLSAYLVKVNLTKNIEVREADSMARTERGTAKEANYWS